MAFFVADEKGRGVALAIGGLIVLMLAAVACWLWYQNRFGTATLLATTPFVPNTRFRGVIETEFARRPSDAVVVQLFGWTARRLAFRVAESVTPERMTSEPNGLVIPFDVPVPSADQVAQANMIRLTVRTWRWPFGWGAMFVISGDL